MKPAEKSFGMEAAIADAFGFVPSLHIVANQCVPAPIGCGKDVTFESFRDELSVREFKISGMCQECQDKFFVEDDE
jgi:hypothetical protein|tara:strand:+ start:37 stop:264 length:228 start_codon:yes stop_codon:yes gene_type:complete